MKKDMEGLAITYKLEFFPSVTSDKPSQVLRIPHGVILGDWLEENIDGFDKNSGIVVYSQKLTDPVLSNISCHAMPKFLRGVKKIVKKVGKQIKRTLRMFGVHIGMPKINANIEPLAQGKSISETQIKSNVAKIGQIVPEHFGKVKIYPDILVPSYSFYNNNRQQITRSLLSVGIGSYEIDYSTIKTGNVRSETLGGITAKIHQPGADLSNIIEAEWWHTNSDVGGTKSNAGLKLGEKRTDSGITESVGSRYYSLRSDGSIIYDGVEYNPGTTLFEKNHRSMSMPVFLINSEVKLHIYRQYEIAGNKITGDFSNIFVSNGDTVNIIGYGVGSYLVTNVESDDGSQGTASSLLSNGDIDPAAQGPITFALSIDNTSIVVSFGVRTSITAYISSINSSINGSPLANKLIASKVTIDTEVEVDGEMTIVQEDRIKITEIGTYSGKRIFINNIQNSDYIFGDTSLMNDEGVTGFPYTQATDQTTITLDRVLNTGPPSVERVAIDSSGIVYTLKSQDNLYKYVLEAVGFSGFSPETSIIGQDFVITNRGTDGVTEASVWIGPFSPCPADELCSEIELDFLFPSGLHGTNNNGYTVANFKIDVEYKSTKSDQWIPISYLYTNSTPDQLGFTEKIVFDEPVSIKYLRVKKGNAPVGQGIEDSKAEWVGLKAKMINYPSIYEDFTTLSIEIKGSDQISQNSLQSINLEATRVLDGVATRKISDAVRYISRTANLDEDDLDEADAYWNGQVKRYFDYSFNSPSTIKQALTISMNAGFAEPIIKDGYISPVINKQKMLYDREQVFSLQNTTTEITKSTSLIDRNETVGIDVEFINPEKEYETDIVSCRLPGSIEGTGKIEKMQLKGVIGKNAAYQHGMRELMTKRYIRSDYSTSTELDALNCDYGDMVGFVSEQPKYSQSMIALHISNGIIDVSEMPEWSSNNVVTIRLPNGELSGLIKASKVVGNDYQIDIGDHNLEIVGGQTNLFFGVSNRMIEHALVRKVKPGSGYKTSIMAEQYNRLIYSFDNATLDNRNTVIACEFNAEKFTIDTGIIPPYVFELGLVESEFTIEDYEPDLMSSAVTSSEFSTNIAKFIPVELDYMSYASSSSEFDIKIKQAQNILLEYESNIDSESLFSIDIVKYNSIELDYESSAVSVSNFNINIDNAIMLVGGDGESVVMDDVSFSIDDYAPEVAAMLFNIDDF